MIYIFKYSLTFITIGFILSISLQYLMYYLARKEKINVFFSLLAFSICVAIIVESELFYNISNKKQSVLLCEAIVSSLNIFFIVYFLCKYLIILFEYSWNKSIFKIIYIVQGVLSFIEAFLFWYHGYDYFINKIFFLFLIALSIEVSIIGGIFIYFLIKQKRSKMVIVIPIISFIVISANFIIDNYLRVINKYEILQRNYFLIGLALWFFSYIIAQKSKVERDIIYNLNTNLKKEVEEATSEIRSQKESNKTMYINFAHEIKTILSVINIALVTFKKEKWEESLEKIREQVARLTKDVLNFLDAAQIERNQMEYTHSTAVDLSSFLKRFMKSRKEAVDKANKVAFKSKIANGLYIKSDIEAIDRLVTNLVENALKYTDKGSVLVELEKAENGIKMSVQDTGIGIKEDNIPRIFDFSYRGDLAIESCKSGYGMGLGMVKHIVDTLNGTIEVISEEGYGSTFTVILPEYKPAPGEKSYDSLVTEVRGRKNPKTGGRKRGKGEELPRILIVDDNEDLRKFLQEELAEEFQVETAEHGQAALDKLEKMPLPEVIVSDRMMPVMDGDDFFKATRKEYHHIPFIFMTAKNEIKDKSAAARKGVVDYIPKPFDFEELEGKLNTHIALRVANAEKIEQKQDIVDLDKVGIDTIRSAVQRYGAEYSLLSQEIDVLIFTIAGKSNKTIAAKLETTTGAVGVAKSRAIKKLPFDRSKVDKVSRHDLARIFRII